MPVQIETQQAEPQTTSDVGGTVGNILGGVLNAATGGVSGLVSAGVGALSNLIFGNTQADKNAQQLQQQQALQNQAIAGSEQLSNFNEQEQVKLFNDTGYQAQVQQMNAAGLNPALIYGRGGGGGGSTAANTAQLPVAQAANAAQMQQAQLQASQQIESMKVMESQANLNNAQAQKIAGADTSLTNTQTASLTQGIQNQKAIQALTQVQTDIATLQKTITADTIDDQELQIVKNAQIAESQAVSAMQDATLDSRTVATKIQLIQQSYANMIIQGNAMKAGINLTNAQINQITNNIQQQWQKLSIEQQDINTKNRAITEYTDNALKVAGIQAASGTVNNIIKIVSTE